MLNLWDFINTFMINGALPGHQRCNLTAIMKHYQMFLFGLQSQAGSDCPYIFVEHLAQQRPGSSGSIVIFFFLDNIYC